MPAITMSRAGPIRTAKTPKRVRFAGEDRDQTRLIRKQEAEKRDARNIPRVDVDVTTSYEIPALSAAAGALFGYAKSKLESARWKLGTAVEYGKSALTSSFTSSFGKISLSFTGEKDQTAPAQQQQASMLEYPPFLAGATPNVVKRNRRDYYQSIGVMSSMKKAKSYAPGSTPARTPDHMQSDKEKNWYRFHETPYAGHKLDFGRGRSLTSLPPPSKPEYRFESPTRNAPKRKTPRSSAKKQQKSALKRRSSKAKLGEAVSRRSNAEEFHANFSGRERNELYASYTRFLTAIRFDVKRFAKDLREMRLPTDTILTIHESMKRSDWDFFMRIMADEEYWGQVKGVGSTKVPVVPQYVEPQPKRGKVFPCEYCRSHNWAGKVEVREIENEGDEIPVHGHTKFDEPYTKEELAHIDAGRYYKVFHRFCHESRYDWKFPDPGRPCSWEGQNHSAAKEGEWSISKYDPRLRHFPLYMQKVPKRVRQIQQDLQDMVTILTAQDRAAWLYIQGIRRHNTRMATLLEKMDLERKRRQVYWPCQMQVQVHVKNKLQPEPVVIEIVDEEPAGSKNKRAHSPTIEEIDPEMNRATSKRQRFLIDKPDRNYRPAYVEDVVDDSEKQQPEENPEEDSRKRTRSEDDEMDDTRMDKRAHTRKNHNRTPPSSFGLFSDEETEDDEQTERVKEWERQQTSKEKGKATMPQSEPKPEPQQEQPKLTWLQKLDAAMKQREAELAAQEAENAKIEAEKAAAKPPAPKPADTVPSILSNKPVLPAFPTTAPAPAPAKPFVFEDPSPTQEQTIPTDDGRNPLKEHTNGVKPSSPAASIPNLFGSAVPNLAPPGFNLGQNNAVSPLKPTGASTSAMFGSGKTGNAGLFGNEENIPTATAATQVTAPAPAAPAPVAPVAPAATVPSLFAPKAPEPAAAAPAFMFGAPAAPAAPASSTAPSTNLFSSAPAPAPAAVSTASETKPTFSLFPTKKEEPKESAEASAAPKTAAPSIFAGLSAAPAATATTSSFVFGAKPAEAAPATSTLFSKPADAAAGGNLFAKPAETNLFAKPAEAAPTSLFAKALETASTNLFAKPTDAPQASNLFPKPAEAAATGLFSKPTGTATTSNLFGNIGGVSAAPVTTTAGPSSVLFGATAPAPAPAPATTTSGLFGAAPATAPVEPPKAFLFGSNTATAPKVDFGIKPTPSTQFDFAGAAKPAGSAPTAFTFGAGGAKPAEPTPAATLFANPTTTSAPSTGITTSGIFTSGATTTAAPAMTTSFPTSNSPFIFGGPPAAPATSMSQSFPPTTPQAPPPSMLFGGFKVQDSPTKQSPGNKFNEDISMASPEQSPEKPSPKTPLFGAATNGIANGMANGNPFNQNKPLFAAAPAAPSPLGKFNFPSAPQPAAPPALSFGTAVSQPGVSMPTTTTTSMATAPVNFSFGNGSFQSMPASMPGVPAPVASQALAPAAAAAPKFQFDATEINLNMNSPSARRPIATPRRRGGKR